MRLKDKYCGGCKQCKPESEFYNNTNIKDGLQTQCKTCKIASSTRWRKLNPEKSKKYQREWKQNNFDKVKASKLKSRYGITLDDYYRMYDEVDGRCEICGEEQVSLCVDHNHTTGKVRGLLCSSCNLMLGNAKDDCNLLNKGVTYLTNAKGGE